MMAFQMVSRERLLYRAEGTISSRWLHCHSEFWLVFGSKSWRSSRPDLTNSKRFVMRSSQLIGVYRRNSRPRPKIQFFRADPVVTETIFERNSQCSKSRIHNLHNVMQSERSEGERAARSTDHTNASALPTAPPAVHDRI